jgi:AcrR family transcriptional regulator
MLYRMANGRTTRVHQTPTKDRRVEKTVALLRGSLGALMGEKPYKNIAVKEILNRANVGRSTFYTHFADKDDLLLSCIEGMLGSSGPGSWGSAKAKARGDILWFSLPVLEHIERHRVTCSDTARPQALHQYLQDAIITLIENDVRAALRTSRAAGHTSPTLLLRWIASTFVLVLNWWAESEQPLPAREADSLFRELVKPSLAKLLS